MSYFDAHPTLIDPVDTLPVEAAAGDFATIVNMRRGGFVRGFFVHCIDQVDADVTAPKIGIKIVRNSEVGTPTVLIGTAEIPDGFATGRNEWFDLVLEAGVDPKFVPGDDLIVSLEVQAVDGAAADGDLRPMAWVDLDPAQP